MLRSIVTAATLLVLSGGFALPAQAAPATGRTETWRCDGSPGPFRMRFSNFRDLPGRARGLNRTIATVSYPDGPSPLGDDAAARRLSIQGRNYTIGSHFEFHLNGRQLLWVSAESGDPITCRRQ